MSRAYSINIVKGYIKELTIFWRIFQCHVPIEVELSGSSKGESIVEALRKDIAILDNGIVRDSLTGSYFSVLFPLV